MAIDFDGVNLVITLDSGVTEVDVREDLYEGWKDWLLGNPENLKYPQAFRPVGGDPLTSVIQAGSYFFLNNVDGWRLKPPEEDITILLTGNLALEDVTRPSVIPTDGAFTAAIFGLQPVTQNVIPEMRDNLRFAVYQNAAWVDQGSGNLGTEYPVASPLAPADDVNDAQSVATTNGFNTLQFIGNYNFSGTDALSGYILLGQGGTETRFQFPAGTLTLNSRFEACELNGDIQGAIAAIDCFVDGLTDVGNAQRETEFDHCYFKPGTAVAISSSATNDIIFRDCDSGSAGDTPVDFDWNGATADGIFRKYGGGIKLLNNTKNNFFSIDGDAHLTIDASCTAGTIAVRGDIKITDNSGGAVTIVDQGMFERVNELWQIFGLDSANPATINEDGTISVGNITINANTTGISPNRITTLTRP